MLLAAPGEFARRCNPDLDIIVGSSCIQLQVTADLYAIV